VRLIEQAAGRAHDKAAANGSQSGMNGAEMGLNGAYFEQLLRQSRGETGSLKEKGFIF
jgi:hypothetical protein